MILTTQCIAKLYDIGMTQPTPGTPSLYRELFERGLGELLMLRQKGDRVLLGNLTMDKGALVLRDRGLIGQVSPDDVAPCWDLGIVGAVAYTPNNEWESLTFLGPDRCKIPVDLSSTRHNVLGRTIAATGETLLTFYGSVYRGFKLMLESNLLPLVLPLPLETHEGVRGLAVTDFRFATVPLDTVRKVFFQVNTTIDHFMTLSVQEVDVDQDEFEKLFGKYRKD